MAKTIAFDIEIIETLYTSLRQFTNNHLMKYERMQTQARMDDVDYLVEDNTRVILLITEMDGTHGRTTLKMVLISNY